MGRAKGLSSRRIMSTTRRATRSCPTSPASRCRSASSSAGAILVEYVFNYPGVGFMLLQAAENEDYALMQALFLLITRRGPARDPRLRHR